MYRSRNIGNRPVNPVGGRYEFLGAWSPTSNTHLGGNDSRRASLYFYGLVANYLPRSGADGDGPWGLRGGRLAPRLSPLRSHLRCLAVLLFLLRMIVHPKGEKITGFILDLNKPTRSSRSGSERE